MDIILVITFVVLGIAFFILEIFFLPGISIGGIGRTIFPMSFLLILIGTTILYVSLAFFLFHKGLKHYSSSNLMGTRG